MDIFLEWHIKLQDPLDQRMIVSCYNTAHTAYISRWFTLKKRLNQWCTLWFKCFFLLINDFPHEVACSRRSDSGAQAKTRFFPALSLALFFARAPLSERLEQATHEVDIQTPLLSSFV